MDIVKWVALVFVAGFIGYFGKYLAQFLIGKFHKRNVERSPVVLPPEGKKDKSDYKAEKKKLKLEIKREKKKESS
jgi:hypothetical protein